MPQLQVPAIYILQRYIPRRLISFDCTRFGFFRWIHGSMRCHVTACHHRYREAQSVAQSGFIEGYTAQ